MNLLTTSTPGIGRKLSKGSNGLVCAGAGNQLRHRLLRPQAQPPTAAPPETPQLRAQGAARRRGWLVRRCSARNRPQTGRWCGLRPFRSVASFG
jgi:hypothetical protein